MLRELGTGEDEKSKNGLASMLKGIWGTEYVDERDARFVNDRVHANIQKDGTFSVIPRIYGGVTSADDLIRIGEVAKKYNVPMVKFTGGQRIDLLGIKKEDLPNVWADLGMPSGYAYTKALRTVKTCVGSEFCRYGTNDSTALGIALEKRYQGFEFPAKVKLGVSGCPRNCAESTVKDVGVIATEGGEWEVSRRRGRGAHVRKTDVLCRVKTQDEAIKVIGRFLIYYRDNAKWLERTYDFVPRVGLEKLEKILVNDALGIGRRPRRRGGEDDRRVRRPVARARQPAFAGPVRGRTRSLHRSPLRGRLTAATASEVTHDGRRSRSPDRSHRVRAGRHCRSGWAGRFRSADKLIAVFRTRTGKVFAVDGVCPHKGGPLADGMLAGEQVVCPLTPSGITATPASATRPGRARSPLPGRGGRRRGRRDGAAGVSHPATMPLPTLAVPDDLAVRTHCPYCAFQCGMMVGDGTADAPAAVQGDPYFPVNNGQLCIKGWTSTTLLRHPDRLTTPLRPERRHADAASWDAALDASPTRSARRRSSTARTRSAFFGSGALTNEKAYLLGKFARVAVGTREHRLQRPVSACRAPRPERTGRSGSTAGCPSP